MARILSSIKDPSYKIFLAGQIENLIKAEPMAGAGNALPEGLSCENNNNKRP